MLLLTDPQLVTLPAFQQKRPQAEGWYESSRRQSTALFRFYLPGSEEEWFALRYDPASTRLLLLRRFGRNDAKSEILCRTTAEVDAFRSARGQALVLDSGFVAVSIKVLLR